MDCEEEDLLDILLVILLRKRRRRRREKALAPKKRAFWVRDIYKEREIYGATRLVNKMRISNREDYFK